jgi:hypothetical protein
LFIKPTGAGFLRTHADEVGPFLFLRCGHAHTSVSFEDRLPGSEFIQQ